MAVQHGAKPDLRASFTIGEGPTAPVQTSHTYVGATLAGIDVEMEGRKPVAHVRLEMLLDKEQAAALREYVQQLHEKYSA